MQLDGGFYQGSDIFCGEFREQVFAMGVDRCYTDKELLCDFIVRPTIGNLCVDCVIWCQMHY